MALRLVFLLAILVGGGLLAVAVATGQAEVGLLLVVPFVVGSGPLPFVGTLLLFFGMVGFFLGTARRVTSPTGRARSDAGTSRAAEEPRTEGGGLIMIGPVPIVVGSDRRTALLAALGGILVLLGLIVAWLLAG